MKKIINLFKSIAVAFSIYSKIPMPPFKWDSDDMKYHMIFFPFVGIVIGFIEALWFYIAKSIGMGNIATTMIAIVLVIFITGGLHIDGFMDTMDALNSYGDRNKKLEILKDPHIGAFSVISLAGYILLYIAVLSEIKDFKLYIIWCLSFIASRCSVGIACMKIEKAKPEGMLNSETDNSSKAVVPWLIAELVITTIIMFIMSWKAALFVAIAEIDLYIFFASIVRKEFGGISGDTAGFYNCIFELIAALSLWIVGWIGLV